MRKISPEAAITLKTPPLSRIHRGASSQVGLVCTREANVSAVAGVEVLLAFLKEKKMHHFQSAFAFPPLPGALGSKRPRLSWFLLGRWCCPGSTRGLGTSSCLFSHPEHVAPQKCPVSRLDAKMMTNCVFLFPEFKQDVICALAPQPVSGSAEAL